MTNDEANVARCWRTWTDVAELFDGPADPAWATDRDRIEHGIVRHHR